MLTEIHLTDDGVPGGEGIFALCTFWLVDNLALTGDVGEARQLFERSAMRTMSACFRRRSIRSAESSSGTTLRASPISL
jgi:GH15 family glucan-1,4-alpha-glucosidase